MPDIRDKVYAAINAERDRQDAKWGSQRALPNLLWLGILMEEVGEAATEVLEHRREEMVDEVVQVAAVAVCWLEALEEIDA